MSKRSQLEKMIIKSATGPDETKFLLGAVDECVSEELQKSDSLLLAEIEELELEVSELQTALDRSKAEADQLSNKLMEATIRENQLKSAFTMDSND